MRLAAAIGVIAVAFAAALWIHQRQATQEYCARYAPGEACASKNVRHRPVHPSWEDPVAVLVGIGGIAVAVGIVAYRNPRFAKPS